MPAERTCPHCEQRMPLVIANWIPDRCCRDGFRPKCRRCTNQTRKERVARMSPEEKAERLRKRAAEAAAWRERVNRDPKRLRARREQQRIAHRLRAERKGENVATPKVDGTATTAPQEQFPALPCRQLGRRLAELLRREARELSYGDPTVRGADEAFGRREVTCKRLGTTEKTVRSWVNGERDSVQFDKADVVLSRADWFYWDVWNEDTVRVPALRVVSYTPKGPPASRERVVECDCGCPAVTFHYRNPTRTACVELGDLGPDLDTLRLVERAFTGDGSTIEDEQLTLMDGPPEGVPDERRRWPRYALKDGSPAAASIDEYLRRKPKRSPTGPAQARKRKAA